MSSLFQFHPGTSNRKASWRIDCSAFSRADIETLAWLGTQLTQPFGSVQGVPPGGLVLAKAMERFVARDGPLLIVDDVFTAGGSMIEALDKSGPQPSFTKGLVIFARGPRPAWVRAIFTLAPDLRRL